MMARLTTLACITLLVLAGCGEQTQAGPAQAQSAAAQISGAAGGGVQIEMAGDDAKKIVLEAESGVIEPPMAVYGDTTPPAGVDGPKGASGGKYAETAEPAEVDPATGKKPELHGGSTTLKFTIPETGKYCFWLRVWWRHKCANSFDVGLDGMPGMVKGMKAHQVTDNTCNDWRWMAVGPSIFKPALIKLEKGEHTLKVTSREDGSVIDQILIVDQADYVPTGAEKAE